MQCPRCRAAIPAGSLFCNACGLPIQQGAGQPAANPPPAAQPQSWQQPTQSWQQPPQAHPQAPPYGQAGYQQAASAAEGYAAVGGIDPDVPRKKPVALLAGLIALVAASAIAGSAVLLSKRNGAVTNSAAAPVPAGAPVTQSASAQLPAGQGVVASPAAVTPAGQPVVASPKSPDGMAPSMLVNQEANPANGGSVTSIQSPAIPNGPAVIAGAPPRVPERQPMTGGPTPPPRAPAPVPPNDDQEVDNYLNWLRSVERQGSRLQGDVEKRKAELTAGTLRDLIDAMSDPSIEGDQRMQRIPQQAQAEFVKLLRVQNAFWPMALRSKPRVPARCQYLDTLYMRAIGLQYQYSQELVQALSTQNPGAALSVGNRSRLISDNLKQADDELQKILADKHMPRDWMIESGGGAGSGLAGLLGGL